MSDEKQKQEDLQQDDQMTSETADASAPLSVEEQCEQYRQGWLRAQADYQNLQKETDRMRSQWAKMSEVQIIEEFIPIYENFKKAFAAQMGDQHAQWENWKKGIEYIMKQYWQVMEARGVKEIETVGKPFDPHLHEAMSEESSDDHQEGQIIRELEGGYIMTDIVLRPAKVVVCKKQD
ncbi:nucleotide exchange factor GrpE [Candidatus Nomurabacteria bacterium]|nr:nucleotide exchange factor GrpE [Candidatus Nomurabacteria bacterium]